MCEELHLDRDGGEVESLHATDFHMYQLAWVHDRGLHYRAILVLDFISSCQVQGLGSLQRGPDDGLPSLAGMTVVV